MVLLPVHLNCILMKRQGWLIKNKIILSICKVFKTSHGNNITWFFPWWKLKIPGSSFWYISCLQHLPSPHPEDLLFGIDTKRKSLTTGQTKFPNFPLIWRTFLKFPDFSLTGNRGSHFSGFPWFPGWLGTLNYFIVSFALQGQID